MTETTPLRMLEVPRDSGCRVLSSPDLGYADGAEQRLLDIVSAAEDLSSSSQELASAATDWATTYSLVPTRANVIRALDLPPDAKVLEIGCGCGPITRYLGETVAVVDSVEPMPARAAVARARTRDLPGVEVYVGTLDDVPAEPAYDAVLVIGVLEYVAGGALDPEPYLAFLRQCHGVLKDGGTLVVAIENPLGVKYISGAVEDHTNRPFDSLEGYALESPARTFPRRTLDAMLGRAGFDARFLAAFPDYKLPRAIMTDELFASSPQLAENLPRFPSPDYLVPRLQLSDERLTWRTLVASGVAEHFANSLIALATKGTGPSLWPDDRQAVLFASERQPQYAVRSEVHAVDGGLQFRRTALFHHRAGAASHGDVRHAPAGVEPVVPGQELLQLLLDAPARRPELLKRWAGLVPEAEWAPVDLAPHNVIVTTDDELVAIDQEWQVRGYDRDAVLLRGLFLCAVELASRTRPERLRPAETVRDLVEAMAAEIGLTVDDDLVQRFTEQEAAFQSAVNTTDATVAARVARSAEDLQKTLTLTLSEVRGGERFDVQFARAGQDIDNLYEMVAQRDATAAEQQGVIADLQKEVSGLQADLAEARKAFYECVAEADALRGRLPSTIARKVAKSALARAGLRRPTQ
ncbi:class I SAM-dependent methyltransferase [Blastococcus saxobsidens]|uniref:Putative methyl transferase n=1 Tax=Blastococcus saxobsidens (strain DD2) TaxID=1146883 RepID=H6RL18_BLASD